MGTGQQVGWSELFPFTPGSRLVDLTELQQRFGAAIRRRRLAVKLAQEKLADQAGIHRTHVSLIERGQCGTRRASSDPSAHFDLRSTAQVRRIEASQL